MKPKVRCFMNLKNEGAGMPDGGLFTADQVRKGGIGGQKPSRGAIEVKPPSADAAAIAATPQVLGYLAGYRQVLVTTLREFVLLGIDERGRPAVLERYTLAITEAEFWALANHPRKADQEQGERFLEFLKRVLLSGATLANPQDLAWFLASYAREARILVELAEVPALDAVRRSLEDSLGVKFEGEKGEHFFRSTLVQTLFYGLFASWVMWSQDHEPGEGATAGVSEVSGAPGGTGARFDWKTAAWTLRVPVVQALFTQIATPHLLGSLGLVPVLDQAAAALNRVDRRAFFSRFEQHHAVQYFYEPFLEAFDPALRKELGVWYTPPEIVEYMVARVDTVLREELDVPDGLADPRVYVLDPCCGTGAYLVEVLEKIAQTLDENGSDALSAGEVKKVAMERVFGFEILPAPFVIAHMQLGLLLQNMHLPLAEHERVGVFLTNALTGWESPHKHEQVSALPELEAERDAAQRVKQELPILVILGNPPYNGFAGMATDEERTLTEAYRTTKTARSPQGQGLNDLYVRFFRMAERRIVEKTGKGIVCFISNYSWLDGLSFTGMRERYLEAFDRIWIDCLNGDAFKTGKLTPEGKPDPSVFSTEHNREGIQLGTAVALLATASRGGTGEVRFRHFWGSTKREDILLSLTDGRPWIHVAPQINLGMAFFPSQVATDYFLWPCVPDLLTFYSPGVNTSRDQDLVDVDLDNLRHRMEVYFDPSVSDTSAATVTPTLLSPTKRFDAVSTRHFLQGRGVDTGQFLRYGYRPLDARWVYWHPATKLLDEKRPELRVDLASANMYLTSRQKAERDREGTPFFVSTALPDRHLTRPGAMCFPMATVRTPDDTGFAVAARANLTTPAEEYLEGHRAAVEGSNPIWFHILAVGYSPLYLTENADGIRLDWPRIPLPNSKDLLLASAALGRQVADLLDPETDV
ncbi:MAG: N-6 DNA methylase, partial [Thermoleophilia bacterium]|nr:N-6 DNA methylase [Thermoleophilia bacterium]